MKKHSLISLLLHAGMSTVLPRHALDCADAQGQGSTLSGVSPEKWMEEGWCDVGEPWMPSPIAADHLLGLPSLEKRRLQPRASSVSAPVGWSSYVTTRGCPRIWCGAANGHPSCSSLPDRQAVVQRPMPCHVVVVSLCVVRRRRPSSSSSHRPPPSTSTKRQPALPFMNLGIAPTQR